MNEEDRKATQQFTILDILAGHCGKQLTPDLVETITTELVAAMQAGPVAWAFGGGV